MDARRTVEVCLRGLYTTMAVQRAGGGRGCGIKHTLLRLMGHGEVRGRQIIAHLGIGCLWTDWFEGDWMDGKGMGRSWWF